MATGLARWAWLPVIASAVALAIVLLPEGRPAPIGAQEATATATPTPTATPAAAIAPDDIGGHIAAIEGPRHGLGSAAEKAKLDEVRDYIHAQLAGFGLTVEEDPVTYYGETFPNVIGTLQGTTCPDTSFIVGAHYDTVNYSPGADDNGSGVAVVLEMARVLSAQSFQPSLEFVGFSFEEDGLIGSRQMATQAAATGRDIAGVLVPDMAAYTCNQPGCQDYPSGLPVPPEAPDIGDFISVIGNSASAPLLQTFLDASASAVPGLPLLPVSALGECEAPEPPAYCLFLGFRSDHAPFRDQGYRALLLTDTASYRNPNYHQPSDTLGTLDPAFAADVANAAVAAVVDSVTADFDADGLADACDNDDDNDGCSDEEELGDDPDLGGTRDSLNPYDFYDVPVPTAFNGGTLDDRDQAITIVDDVLAVLEYSGTSDGGPCNNGPDGQPSTADDRCYKQDNNGDGQDDGLLYDRSAGATWSDAPNAAVTIIEDVLLVLAQGGHSCQAPP